MSSPARRTLPGPCCTKPRETASAARQALAVDARGSGMHSQSQVANLRTSRRKCVHMHIQTVNITVLKKRSRRVIVPPSRAAKTWPNSGQIWWKPAYVAGRFRGKLGQFRPILAEFKRRRAYDNVDENGLHRKFAGPCSGELIEQLSASCKEPTRASGADAPRRNPNLAQRAVMRHEAVVRGRTGVQQRKHDVPAGARRTRGVQRVQTCKVKADKSAHRKSDRNA